MVAHNGYKYDFPILLAEIDRRPKTLNPASLITHRLEFADSSIPTKGMKQEQIDMQAMCINSSNTTALVQVKKGGKHAALKDVKKFGLESL